MHFQGDSGGPLIISTGVDKFELVGEYIVIIFHGKNSGVDFSSPSNFPRCLS